MSSAVLQAQDLVKRYGDFTAVDGVSFSVAEGECLALLGPNGAGKTTTVEMLEGLKEPDSGAVTIFGLDLAAKRTEVMEKVGVLLQETNLYKKLTVKETLELFRSFFKEGVAVEEVIKVIELEDKADNRLEQLSGGQKQRAYIGCALVNQPKLLFLDEPTTGLDPQARRMIWDLLESYKERKCSILLTTHYMDEAEQLADRILVIDHGKIIAEGSPAELIATHCGAQRMTFKCESPDGLTAAKIALKNHLPWFAKAKEDAEHTGVFEIDTEEPGRYLQDLIGTCNAQGLSLVEIAMRRSTLEDVFIKLTGRSIRDG